uniref:Ribosomal protein S11 n=1 Tax=Palmaria palmata TaxID=2822 RepID=A0A0A7A734_PALPL|nr:ribosomal protein S11 [Palmaria palmata]AHB62158.1 ribosomal protein S11 [Palmaria palmata]
MKTNVKKTGILFVLFTSNNVICTFTNLTGDVLLWTSAGCQKSKGLKKSVSTIVYNSIIKILAKSLSLEFSYIHLKLKGLSKNKKSITKALSSTKVNLLSIQDLTALPHNGCRIARQRRL